MICSIPLSGGSPDASANTSANCDLMPSSRRISVNAVSGAAAEAGALHGADAEAAQGEIVVRGYTGTAIANISVRNQS